MNIFKEFRLKDTVIKNRIVMPPICMYQSDNDGMVKDFHYMHYTTRAIGGAGLIILEATAVTPNGRISVNDLGIWDDRHVEGLRRITEGCRSYGALSAIQINHAGRKCGSGDEDIVAPSPIRFSEDYKTPREMTKEDIKQVVQYFKDAARRAFQAGFDMLEIHAAHGYLISEFLSPLSNHREDEYGGSVTGRTRFLKEVLEAVRTEWPESKPLIIRVSASDYVEGGMDVDQMVQVVNEVKHLIDVVHVSSGAVVQARLNVYPGYQISFADTIKKECNIPTIAVGLITKPEMAEEIVASGRADFVALGRELLRNPYWVLDTAYKNGVKYDFPVPYKRAFM